MFENEMAFQVLLTLSTQTGNCAFNIYKISMMQVVNSIFIFFSTCRANYFDKNSDVKIVKFNDLLADMFLPVCLHFYSIGRKN